MKSECIRFYFQSIKIQIESNLSKMGFIHNLKLDLIFTRGMQCKTKVSWEDQEKFEKYTFALPPVFIKVLRSHFICCQVFVCVDTASREKRYTSWQRYKDPHQTDQTPRMASDKIESNSKDNYLDWLGMKEDIWL